MPHLVGIWNPTSTETVVKTVVDRQMARVRVPGVSYSDYVHVEAGFGMGLIDHGILENGPQPVRSADGRYVLMLDGEILNRQDLHKAFRSELPDHPLSSPELCLRLILAHGAEIADRFIGAFAIVLYDRKTRQVTMIADSYAYRPLFYRHQSGSLVFGTELKALCAGDPNSRAIDELGTFELFAYGTHVIDRTWLQGCLRMAPATILTIDADGLRQREYWRYRYDEQAPKFDQSTYYTVYGALLDRAVERSMAGSHRVGLFLSGGYDSRCVAASIRHCHRPVPAFTFGQAESRDVRFASMLAARLGLDHRALTEQTTYLYRYCRGIVWRTEGMSTFANCTSLRYHRILKAKLDIILLGFLAEFNGSHTWPQLLMARTREAAMEALYTRLVGSRLPLIRRLFMPTFYNRMIEGLRDRFQTSCDRIQNDHPQNMSDSWQFLHQQPFSGFQTASVDRHQFESRAPLMDRELVNFLLTIPPAQRLEQRIYKRMIAYRFPDIRDIPCANSARPINPHFAQEYILMTLRYAGRKLASPFQTWGRSAPPLGREFRDLDEEFRAEPQLMEHILRPLLKQGVFPGEMFNLTEIQALIDDHYHAKGRHSGLLSQLISWGLAVQFLVVDDAPAIPTELIEAGTANQSRAA